MARVLVVDDEERIRTTVRRVLRLHHHEVVEAADGNEAIRLAQTSNHDIALVDYMMQPGPWGDIVLQTLCDADPGCARVLMTAMADDAGLIRDIVNRANIAYTLAKPFDEGLLIKAVDQALKVTENVRQHYRKDVAVSAARRDWRESVDKGLLSLAIQPIVQAPWPHGITAVECLLRSRHPTLSRPDLILAAVEKIGAYFELGAEVNRMAAQWAECLPPEILIFVNLHPAQFADPNLMDTFRPLLPHAHRVVLEITERADMHENTNWEKQVEMLTGAGFQFALDDLGAGYNGLKLLAELRPTFIKIDMSIIRGIHLKQRNQSLVDLIAKFAAANGERVVGEGVETAEEAQTLIRCGVHQLQGYLFGKPGSAWPVAR